MKKRNLLSFLLAAVLIATTVVGFLFTEAQAAPEAITVIYAVGDVEADGENVVKVGTVDEAFSLIQAKSREWKENDAVEIRFKGQCSGSAQNGLLFNLKTVWRENGTKLPITIRGVDANKERDAYIYLDAGGGFYACANDYTFINLTLPIGDAKTDFYAGSGNIRFENVDFGGAGTGSVPNLSAQAKVTEHLKAVADYFEADENDIIVPDLSVIPVGEAWQMLRDSDPEIGQGLCDTAALGKYGDYVHDGDIGGGQYLNACIYFEVMTGKSCIGNTWRPTAYTLSEDLVELLQETAHAAVTARYGEDHYNTVKTDIVGNDGWINVLLLGSSNGYYFPDELVEIANAAGINMRVVHGYASGLKLSSQALWIEQLEGISSGNGKGYEVRIHESGESVSVKKGQSLLDILSLDYQWDTITTWQCSTGFANSERAADGYTEEDLDYVLNTTCVPYLRGELGIFNYIYSKNNEYKNNTSADVEWYWYEPFAFPVNNVGSEIEIKGNIYADTCTNAVFSGWDELEPGEVVETSVTFGEGCIFKAKESGHIAVVGYGDAPATPYTPETAAQVTYPSISGYDDNIPDIRPTDIKASIIVDGESVSLGDCFVKKGFAPVDGELVLKQGGTGALYGAKSSASSTVNYYGDVNIEISAEASPTGKIRGLEGGDTGGKNLILTGDLTLNFDGGSSKDSSANTVETYMVENASVVGTVSFTVENGRFAKIACIRDGHVTGNVTNTLSNVGVAGEFYSVWGTALGSANDPRATVTGSITNTFTDCSFNNELGLACRAAMDTVTGDVTTTMTDCSAASIVEGNRYGHVLGCIRTTINGGTFDGAIFGAARIASVYDSSAGSLELTINSGTFNGIVYGAGYSKDAFVSQVTINGGTFNKPVYFGTNATVTSAVINTVTADLTNTITDGVFNDLVYGGNAAGDLIGNITNNIEGGTFNSDVYGGNAAGKLTGSIANNIEGGTFNRGCCFGGNGGSVGKDEKGNSVTTTISGGKFTNGGYFIYLAGGTDQCDLSGAVDIEITGGEFSGWVALARYGKLKNSVNYTITGGEFKREFWLGLDCYNATQAQNSYFDGKTTVDISGGTFADLRTLSCNGGTTGVIYTAPIELNISGGTFTGLTLAGYYCDFRQSDPSITLNLTGGTLINPIVVRDSNAIKSCSSVVVNVEPKDGDITLNSVLSHSDPSDRINLKGGAYCIKLDKDAQILADTYDNNALTVHQTEEWTPAVVYVQVSDVDLNGMTFTKDAGKNGEIRKNETDSLTQWLGSNATVSAASLILEDRIAIRLWFDKDMVDFMDEFSFEVWNNGTRLVSEMTKDDLEIKKNEGKEYYTYVLPALSAQKFHEKLLIQGMGIEEYEFSLNDLAEIVIEDRQNIFSAEFEELAKAIYNYGVGAYDRFSGSTSQLTKYGLSEPETVTIVTALQNGDGANYWCFTNRALVLKNAVGLKLYGMLADGISIDDLTIKVNGEELQSGEYVFTNEEGASYNGAIAIYVHALSMSETLTIEVSYNGVLCSALTESVASAAQAYVNDPNSRDAAVCKDLLVYIEKAENYFN